MKTLVVGLGNPILCDDGIGNRVAQELAARVHFPDVTIIETSGSGLHFIDILTGYDRAIIIDAIMGGKSRRGKNRPGQIVKLSIEQINTTIHSTSSHDISLGEVLELGKRMGAKMPDKIILFGIEVTNIDTFSETCTPEVEAAIPECIERVMAEISEE
jgi:hydrogenase maturation protease